MSDPCAELRPALKALLRADMGVLITLGGQVAKVVDVPPTNLAAPYVVIGEVGAVPELAECIDGADADVTLNVFSRTSPPSFTEANAIAKAVETAILGANLVLTSHRVADIEAVSARTLLDADTVTAHVVLVFRFHTEAL